MVAAMTNRRHPHKRPPGPLIRHVPGKRKGGSCLSLNVALASESARAAPSLDGNLHFVDHVPIAGAPHLGSVHDYT